MGCDMWPKKIDKLQCFPLDMQTVFPGAFQTVMGVYSSTDNLLLLLETSAWIRCW